MEYDVFISHASEDKAYVRRLAQRLRDAGVEVWFDEFELRIGDSIRHSVDRGLRQARFGIVVLSKAFFSKNWTQYELDGLVEREMENGQKVILPIWLGVSHSEVKSYSPALANRFAASSDRSIKYVLRSILEVVSPNGNPLAAARELMISRGVSPPPPSDSYWLDAIQATTLVCPFVRPRKVDSWGTWAFPLPSTEGSHDAKDRGRQIGWAALQIEWIRRAGSLRITPYSPPEKVLEYIGSSAGLAEACRSNPEIVASYAPQLVIPGYGGDLESVFEAGYANWCKLASNPSAVWSVRHSFFGSSVAAADVTQAYLRYAPTLLKPSPPDADLLIWLLSSSSNWLPATIRTQLFLGLAELWEFESFWSEAEADWLDAGAAREEFTKAHVRAGHRIEWQLQTARDWLARITLTREGLALPESPSELFALLRDSKFIERAVGANSGSIR